MKRKESRRPTPAAFDGKITRNQMILRFDPDDDDAESDEIDRIAQEHVDSIANGLAAQLAHIEAAAASIGEIQRRMDTLPTQPLRDALDALLRASAGRGVRMSATTLESVMAGVDWRLAHEMAMAWANSYSYELVSYITSNSRQFIADAMVGWVRDGGPMGDLVDRLAVRFGRARAEMIAVTESTRAYAEGSRLEFRSAGIRKVAILTNRDDLVCEICWPHDGEIVDIDSGIPGLGFPPLHVRCRCYLAPYIESRPPAGV